MRVTALPLALLAACSSSESVDDGRLVAAAETTGGRIVIDIRDPREFAAGHERGALNLQWGWDQLVGRARAYVPDTATPIALRGATEAGSREARSTLARLGYTDVVVLSGEAAETQLGELRLITARELAERLTADDAPIVIDGMSAWYDLPD